MSFDPRLQPGEYVHHLINVQIPKREALHLLLTSKAAYWPAKKWLALSDPVTTEVLPTSQIQRAVFRPRKAYDFLIVGILLILVGLALTVAGRFGFPQLMIAGGLVLAPLGRKRRVVTLNGVSSRFIWKEPFLIAGKDIITAAFAQIEQWANRHGIEVENASRAPQSGKR